MELSSQETRIRCLRNLRVGEPVVYTATGRTGAAAT